MNGYTARKVNKNSQSKTGLSNLLKHIDELKQWLVRNFLNAKHCLTPCFTSCTYSAPPMKPLTSSEHGCVHL